MAPARTLSATITASSLLVVVLLAILHVIRRDIDPLTQSASLYVHGPWGFLMTVAFLALAAGMGVASFALVREGPRGRATRIGAVLLGLVAVAFVVVAIFPADASGNVDTTSGAVHNLGGAASVLLGAVGAIVVSATFGKDARWRSARGLALTLAILIPLAMVATILAPSSVEGAIERFVPLAMCAWLLVVASRLRQVGSAAPRRAGDAAAEP